MKGWKSIILAKWKTDSVSWISILLALAALMLWLSQTSCSSGGNKQAFAPHFEGSKQSVKSARDKTVELSGIQTQSLQKQMDILVDALEKTVKKAFHIRIIDLVAKGAGLEDQTDDLTKQIALEFYMTDGDRSYEDLETAISDIESIVALMRKRTFTNKKDDNGNVVESAAFWTLYKEIQKSKSWKLDFQKDYPKESIDDIQRWIMDYENRREKLPVVQNLKQYNKSVQKQLSTWHEANSKVADSNLEFAQESIDHLTILLALMEDSQRAVQLFNKVEESFVKLSKSVIDKVNSTKEDSDVTEEDAEKAGENVETVIGGGIK